MRNCLYKLFVGIAYAIVVLIILAGFLAGLIILGYNKIFGVKMFYWEKEEFQNNLKNPSNRITGLMGCEFDFQSPRLKNFSLEKFDCSNN